MSDVVQLVVVLTVFVVVYRILDVIQAYYQDRD